MRAQPCAPACVRSHVLLRACAAMRDIFYSNNSIGSDFPLLFNLSIILFEIQHSNEPTLIGQQEEKRTIRKRNAEDQIRLKEIDEIRTATQKDTHPSHTSRSPVHYQRS